MVATTRHRSCLSTRYAAGLLLLPTLAGLTGAVEPAQSAAAALSQALHARRELVPAAK